MKSLSRKKFICLIGVWGYLCVSVVNCDKQSHEIRYDHGSTSTQLAGVVKNDSLTGNPNNRGTAVLPAVAANSAEGNSLLAEKNTKTDVAAKNITLKSNSSNDTHDPGPTKLTPSVINLPTLNPGALKRGFYVFVGLSIIVLAYITFRCSRLNKSRSAQMVRKYGIVAHRQDVEMRPLPLDDEDEDDTTVFDASNVLSHNAQHQNA